jgi:hypothetical protein
LRRLAEDGDDNDAPAHARQFRHHLYTRFGTRYLKDDIRACGAGLFLNQRDEIDFFGIDYLDAEISQQLDAERIHFRHQRARALLFRDQRDQCADRPSAQDDDKFTRLHFAQTHVMTCHGDGFDERALFQGERVR